MKFPRIARSLPSWQNALLAVISAILLILAFPDFDLWFLAWFALVPLLVAIERGKESSAHSFVCGWLFGFVFFTGSCWWLTYAPIHYAGFPVILAYFLLCCVTAVVGVFPGLFASILGRELRKVGMSAWAEVGIIWVFTEFARYWITGNDWNAYGYSMAFNSLVKDFASLGGVLAVSSVLVSINGGIACALIALKAARTPKKYYLVIFGPISFLLILTYWLGGSTSEVSSNLTSPDHVVAVQPNVPMAGLDADRWTELRDRQISLAENALLRDKEEGRGEKEKGSTTVILPESPMNYQWDEDVDFQRFIGQFAARNNVSVLFNSAEPDRENHKYFNSAVMIDQTGREVAEYDKIYLLPFGEAVPTPLENIVPGFVGNFSYGRNYGLVPLGDAKAGIMICFESHFGQLSREYVRRGADAIIEMTNDGYLGPTPVLRQHLANAVFRAIETNRPVLRVTNVGITAYITERGEVLDATQPYTEDTRVWSVAKSDGSQTFYVKYGDWFAWLCTIITALSLFGSLIRRPSNDGSTSSGS
jgi:apolipoprotein N-acyltransferase